MARRIYAGADFFVMPSRFEPCGQGQMIALRYGTPPIVHRDRRPGRHGHRRDDAPGRGTGFVFNGATVGGPALRVRARDPHARGRGSPWEALLDRGMAVDFDWVTGSAPRYVDAYRRALQIRREGAPAATHP